MRCPQCNKDSCKITNSRPTANNVQRRRRECTECGNRFSTYEIVDGKKLNKLYEFVKENFSCEE